MNIRRVVHTITVALLMTGLGQGARIDPARLIPNQGFADVVAQVMPSVVRIKAFRTVGAGEGSGVIVDRDGFIVTNNHVVDGATRITVQFHDEKELVAVVAAADAELDIAVIRVTANNLPAASFGNSATLRAGEFVLALGNPFGAGMTVSHGIAGTTEKAGYIQTDAAINPGNSGGPLINVDGEVIGINTAILTASGGSNGVGFALPSNLVRRVTAELMSQGRVRHGYLGAGLQPMNAELAAALGSTAPDGVLVADVAADSPASAAGLKKADVIFEINGRPLRDMRRFQLFVAASKPGDKLSVKLMREGAEVAVNIILAERPAPDSANETSAAINGALLAETPAGLLLAAHEPASTLAASGLNPGDLIVSIDRQKVSTLAELRRRFETAGNRPLLVEVTRGGSNYFFALARL